MPLKFTERFRKQYIKLPSAIRLKVDKSLKLLDADFRHPGLRSHPVEGVPGIFEAYIDRKYRLTYERSGDILILRNVDKNDECLRNP
jgi:hypothetical protein